MKKTTRRQMRQLESDRHVLRLAKETVRVLSVRDLKRAIGAQNCDTTSVTTESGATTTVGTDAFTEHCAATVACI
jgi:hypothetical protein